MISRQLLGMIRCPCTGQSLEIASPEMIRVLNVEVQSGQLFNQLGLPVEKEFEEGLVNSSATCFIMVRNNVPELSPDHVIPIDHLEFLEPN